MHTSATRRRPARSGGAGRSGGAAGVAVGARRDPNFAPPDRLRSLADANDLRIIGWETGAFTAQVRIVGQALALFEPAYVAVVRDVACNGVLFSVRSNERRRSVAASLP